MENWKRWLGDIYKRGSEEVRTCIVQATLEHLREQGAFRRFFADWVKDPPLRKAYEEALEWYERGGRTPLGKSPRVQPLVRSQLQKSRFRAEIGCTKGNDGCGRPSLHSGLVKFPG